MRFISFCALMLATPLIGAESYILSYRIAVRDGIVINQRYNVAKAMVNTGKYTLKGECQLTIEKEHRSAFRFLKESPEDILTCLFRHDVGLRDDTSTNNHRSKSTTTLQIAPTHVIVEFKDRLTIMKIIQPK
ncbi:MAG: hypothetical protein ACTTJS_07480 [Wolinella sp.]